MKIKYVKEKLWDSGFQWFEVLSKEDKKNQLKKTNRKEKDKSHKKSVHSGTTTGGNWTLILEKLSRLIGAWDWSETNAKCFLRNWIVCV